MHGDADSDGPRGGLIRAAATIEHEALKQGISTGERKRREENKRRKDRRERRRLEERKEKKKREEKRNERLNGSDRRKHQCDIAGQSRPLDPCSWES